MGTGLVCVVCVCLFGLYCYACALHCQTVARGPTNACFGRTPSPRWDTVRDMGWWHAHRARPGRAICSATWQDLGCLRPLFLASWRPSGASHGALTHDCLVHARGLVGPAPLRVVDAPNLPNALTVLTLPLCLPWEILRELISSEERPLRPFLGGNSRRWRLVTWSRPLTWWGMPSRGAARRSCRTRAGGHSGMGSRMRAD